MILPTNREDLIKEVLRIHDRTSEYIDTERINWRTYYKLYRSYIDEDSYPFRHKVFLPWVFSLIETILPRFVAGLLYRTPLLEGSRASSTTTKQAVRTAMRLLNKKWMIDEQTFFSILMMLKEAILYGTSSYKLTWSKQYEARPTWYPPTMVDGKMVMQMGNLQQTLIENRPRLIHRDIFDVVPDLMNGHDPQFVSDFSVQPWDVLNASNIRYHNLDDLKDDEDFNFGRDGNWRAERLSSVELNTAPDLIYNINDPRGILEMTVKEHTRNGIENRVITIGNRKHILRDEVIPIWPWGFIRNYQNPHEMLGVSEIAAIEGLQHNYNHHFNMLLDNNLMAMTKMFMVGDAAEADLDNFVVEPMGVLQVADISQVQELRFQDMPAEAFGLNKFFSDMMSSTVGINDYLRGSNPPRKEFATTVLALQQASEARMDMKIKLFERGGIAPIAKGFINLAQYELDEYEEVYDKKTDEFEQVSAYDIQGLMDWEVSASSMGQNELLRQQLIDFTTTASQLLGQDTPLPVRLQLLTAISETFNNDSIDEAMDNAQQLIKQLQQQQAQQAQQQPPPGTQPGVPNQSAPPQQSNGNARLGALASTFAAAQGGAPKAAIPPQ